MRDRSAHELLVARADHLKVRPRLRVKKHPLSLWRRIIKLLKGK